MIFPLRESAGLCSAVNEKSTQRQALSAAAKMLPRFEKTAIDRDF
jgi:hypothetical protein